MLDVASLIFGQGRVCQLADDFSDQLRVLDGKADQREFFLVSLY